MRRCMNLANLTPVQVFPKVFSTPHSYIDFPRVYAWALRSKMRRCMNLENLSHLLVLSKVFSTLDSYIDFFCNRPLVAGFKDEKMHES